MVRGFTFSVEGAAKEICNRTAEALVVPGEAMESGSIGAMEGVMPTEGLEAMSMFGFLAVGAIALFTMIAVSSWADARRRERESYYRNDMLKKLAEAQGAGAESALQLLREEARLEAIRKRQDMRIAGLVTLAVGIGLTIFLRALIPHAPIFLCGPLIMLIGVALYGGSYLVTTPDTPAGGGV